jgi:hypothetical protein
MIRDRQGTGSQNHRHAVPLCDLDEFDEAWAARGKKMVRYAIDWATPISWGWCSEQTRLAANVLRALSKLEAAIGEADQRRQ